MVVMSPMEFTPVEYSDVLAAQAVDVIAGQRGAAGLVPWETTFDFAANVDGPWVCRSWDEFAVEMNALTEAYTHLREAGLGRDIDEFSDRELFVKGVYRAMRWTLAVTQESPLGFCPAVVSNAEVAAQEALGQRMATASDRTIAWVAAGVVFWLRWIMGKNEVIAYPPA